MSYVGSARLEDDDLDTFDLTIAQGFAVDSLDLGFPTIRSVIDPNTDRDGDDDRTRLHGARGVVLAGTIVPTATLTRQQVLDRLGGFLVPTRRPFLVYELETGSGLRRIRLRPDQHSRPIVVPGSVRVTVGWRGPDGIQEAYEAVELDAIAGLETEPGRDYDLEFDFDYADGAIAGLAETDNPGNLPSWPVITMYGPLSDPRIENIGTQQRLEFQGVAVADGDYLVVDMAARTALLNGTGNRWGQIDLAESAPWWPITPGFNAIRFYPAAFDTGAHAEIVYRPAWI